MRFKIEKHWVYRDKWCIINETKCLCVFKYPFTNFKYKLIDEKYVVKKFYAEIDRGIFLFNIEGDAIKALEYMEPLIIMEKLVGE